MMLSQTLPYVFALDNVEPLSRLRMYAGTSLCDAATAAAFGYEPDAILPRGLPQRLAVDARICRCVYGTLPLAYANFIGVINVRAAMQPLLDLGISEIRSASDLQEIKADAGYPAAFEELLVRLSNCLDISGTVHPLDVTIKTPGLPTVSVNDNTGNRVGLHVDSWDRGTARNRACARNRINMNFGREPRYFLVVNTSLFTSARLSGLEFDSYDRVARFVREILEGTPDLEIVRIQVDPGEAYIAPTDNIIHDATTLNMKQIDVSLSVLGRLAFRADSVVNVLMTGANREANALGPLESWAGG